MSCGYFEFREQKLIRSLKMFSNEKVFFILPFVCLLFMYMFIARSKNWKNLIYCVYIQQECAWTIKMYEKWQFCRFLHMISRFTWQKQRYLLIGKYTWQKNSECSVEDPLFPEILQYSQWPCLSSEFYPLWGMSGLNPSAALQWATTSSDQQQVYLVEKN